MIESRFGFLVNTVMGMASGTINDAGLCSCVWSLSGNQQAPGGCKGDIGLLLVYGWLLY